MDAQNMQNTHLSQGIDDLRPQFSTLHFGIKLENKSLVSWSKVL